jgi:hypothetical protein
LELRFGRRTSKALRRALAFYRELEQRRTHPGDVNDRSNWLGGSYSLAIEIGRRDDERLAQVAETLWSVAGVEGGFATIELVSGGQPKSALTLPSGDRVVCSIWAMRLDNGSDWISLDLPLGALIRVDPRIGTFPLGSDGGPQSLSWRRPLDEWLLTVVAAQVFARSPFLFALTGFDPAGEAPPVESRSGIAATRAFGYLMPVNGTLRYLEADA